jgi:LacI family transcriptional regulator, repressor for deo operon, udp, cdd, tsx, nupC, and nupG
MRIRLQDVAARAGVSEATVSRVINGKPGVSPAKRDLVLGVLAELGYEPPGLRDTARVGLVGLIVPELNNPIFPAYAQSIEARLLTRGYVSVLCCAGRTGATEDDYIPNLIEHGVAGIIVVSGRHADTEGDHELYRQLVRRGTPLVFVNGAVEGLDVPSVSCDEERAAAIAVEHLAQLGHRRVGFLTGPTVYVPVIRRLAGFRNAIAEFGLDPGDELVASSIFTVAGGRVGAQRLLDAGATAIVAASDLMALGAVRAVREAKRRVPDDVSVVGYDDTELMAFTDPPLTTVRQPVDTISEHCVELLLAQIAGQPFRTSEYRVRPELVVRGTTARAPQLATRGRSRS